LLQILSPLQSKYIQDPPGVVAHTCNPSYLGNRDRISVQGQPRQKKLVRPNLQEQARSLDIVTQLYNPRYVGGIGRRIGLWGKPT
jgi:hypothetical protein